MKRVCNLVKKIGKMYFESIAKMYGPVINAGVNPWV